jgi:transposase
VWYPPGRNAATLQAFFDLLGERKQSIRAVSIDMSGGYEKAIRERLPDAQIAFDPFHVVRLSQRAVDQLRRDEYNAHERSHTKTGRWIKGTRWSLLKAPAKQTCSSSLCCIRSSRPTRSTAPSCSRRSCACSNNSRARRSRPRTSTPGSPGHHPGRDPPQAQQRAPRKSQQPHPADQPPQLRIPLRRTAHRPRLPLLQRHPHPTAPVTFTTERTGAPVKRRSGAYVQFNGN